MPISKYMQELRRMVGHALVLAPGVGAIVRDEEGRILLQRVAEDDSWSLPAGAIDPGETPAQAIVREVREETGLHVRPVRIVGVFGGKELMRKRYPNGDEVEFTAIIFECETVGGELGGLDGETAELRYFRVDEMPEIRTGYPRELFEQGRREALFQPL